MTMAIFTGRAPSLIMVSETIAHVANRLGVPAEVLRGMRLFTHIVRRYDRVIIFQPFYPTSVFTWISLYTSLRKLGRPCLFYTTAEGPPVPSQLPEWVKKSVELIANSNYTAEVLREVGLNVVRVVPHGILMDDINYVRENVRRRVMKSNRESIVFGTLSSAIERKGMDKLPIIARKCLEEVPEARFEVITTPDAPMELAELPNVSFIPSFGNLERLELLSRMATWDFYLCPSHSEGFGLPMVEAQAMGIPCIHADFPPLSEVLHPENLKVEVTDIVDYQPEGYGAIWRLHMYDPDEVVEQIKRACELRRDGETYNQLSKKLVQYSKRFDAMKVYKELVPRDANP